MFSARLRQARTEMKLTQAQLADAIGVSTGTITMWETGKREPNYIKLTQLAHFFNCSTDYLLGESETNKMSEPDAEKSTWHVDACMRDHTMMYLRLDAEGYSRVTSTILKEFERCKDGNLLKPSDDISLTLFCK